jgi:N-acetylneuraminic acid mutarotase
VAFGRVKIESSQEQSKEVKEKPKKNTFSFKGGFSLVEKQVAVIDALQVYDSQTGKWNISNCTGRHPNVRSYHYAIYESPHLVIYGGIDKKALNDMFVLNCKTLVWKKMFNLESPPARIAGAFVSLKDKKYLIGGCKYP